MSNNILKEMLYGNVKKMINSSVLEVLTSDSEIQLILSDLESVAQSMEHQNNQSAIFTAHGTLLAFCSLAN